MPDADEGGLRGGCAARWPTAGAGRDARGPVARTSISRGACRPQDPRGPFYLAAVSSQRHNGLTFCRCDSVKAKWRTEATMLPTPNAMERSSAFAETTAERSFCRQPPMPTPRTSMEAAVSSNATGSTIYTCPMHPEVQQDHPGNCPKCGMTLEPKTTAAGTNVEESSELSNMTRRFPSCVGVRVLHSGVCPWPAPMRLKLPLQLR